MAQPSSANYKEVRVSDNLTVYYSYDTIIAFRHKGKLSITQNNWSVTTGKALNWICSDKSIRIPHSELMEKYNEIVKNI